MTIKILILEKTLTLPRDIFISLRQKLLFTHYLSNF